MTETKKNRYEKRFTEENIKAVIPEQPNGVMLRKIISDAGCSEMTARKLLDPLIRSGEVIKINIGSDTKPYYLYMKKSIKENKEG